MNETQTLIQERCVSLIEFRGGDEDALSELRVLAGFLPWDEALPVLLHIDPEMSDEDIENIGPEARIPWEPDEQRTFVLPRIDDHMAFLWRRAEDDEWAKVNLGLGRLRALLLASDIGLRTVACALLDRKDRTGSQKLMQLHELLDWPIPDFAVEKYR